MNSFESLIMGLIYSKYFLSDVFTSIFKGGGTFLSDSVLIRYTDTRSITFSHLSALILLVISDWIGTRSSCQARMLLNCTSPAYLPLLS